MFQPLRSLANRDSEAIRQVKAWVRDRFTLGDEATILVSEVRCLEDDCPDVETVIALLEDPGQSRKYKLLLPVGEVTREAIQQLPDSPPQHGQH